MTNYDRALAYVAKIPGAVSGQGGHAATYNVARVLAHDFALDESEALDIFQRWNATCAPPWSEKDLRYKLNQALQKPHSLERGNKLTESGGGRKISPPNASNVSATGKFVYRAGAEIPAKVELPDGREQTKKFLQSTFLAGETICICFQSIEGADGKFRPGSNGTFQKLEWWLEKIDEGIVNEKSDAGRWIRINPYKEGARDGSDANVESFRHVLVEFDSLPETQQIEILHQSKLPISAIVSSGGKSVHAWVRVDAPDKRVWEARRDAIYEYLSDYKPDPANKNLGRYSRLAGCARGANMQELVSARVGIETWEAWEIWRKTSDLPQGLTYQQIREVQTNPDPTCLFGNRWLCEGGSMVLVGPSGVGKSTLTLQFATAWAVGMPIFGISPQKGPRKVGLIQAENDLGDVKEGMDGAVMWLCKQKAASADTAAHLKKNLIFFRESSKTGAEFLAILRTLIKEHALDVVFIDPFLAFYGDDVNDQKSMSTYLRNGLQPIIEETKVLVVFIHHTAKPKERGNHTNELAYSGAGSSDLTNWAREIAVLSRDSEDSAFLLTLCKRGRRAGMLNAKRAETHQIRIEHSPEGMFWDYAPEKAESDDKKVFKPKFKSNPPRKGRKDDE
jgi:RecA-family ATPase